MKFSRLLVLCEANICRSPLAEHLIHNLTARTGELADPVYLDMARDLSLDLSQHRSKPVTRELLRDADLALVMTVDQKRRLAERYPEFSGKMMLLGHWLEDGVSISDPHRKSIEAYRAVFAQIHDACGLWAGKL